MPAQYLGPFNGRLPTHEASGKLIVDFSRNPKKFALPNYAQYVPMNGAAGAKDNQGLYYVMGTDEAVRLTDDEGADTAWADGQERPGGTIDEKFTPQTFRTMRRERGFKAGYDTANLADWNVLAQRSSLATSRLMTLRTHLGIKKLTTAGNYAANHVSAISGGSIPGTSGTWAASTAARQDIKRSLLYAADLINIETNAVVTLDDMMLVMSPSDARVLAETQEISDFIKSSPAAKEYVFGGMKGQNRNAKWGLPPTLHGVEIVIEDAVKNTAKKGATSAKSRIWPANTAVLMSRVGELEGVQADAPSFSTLTIFLREEMNIETKDDSWNRRTIGSVVDDYFVALTAPVSAFVFTGIVS